MSSRAYEVVATSTDEAAWLEARNTMLTASDVYKVVHGTPAAYKQLLGEKRGELPRKDISKLKPVAAGKAAEEGILNLWCTLEDRRAKLTPILCRSKRFPFLGATPDGLCWDDMEEEAGIVEVKLVTT